MLRRKYRLRRQKSFRYIYRRGRSSGTRIMSLVFVKAGGADSMKVGFSVSKKIGNSVVRNKVKRRMRENFRSLLPEISTGYNMIFVARAGIQDVDFQTIGKDMEKLLSKRGLLIGNKQ